MGNGAFSPPKYTDSPGSSWVAGVLSHFMPLGSGHWHTNTIITPMAIYVCPDSDCLGSILGRYFGPFPSE